jgi:hypothetical protein
MAKQDDEGLRRRAREVGEQLQRAVESLLSELARRGAHDQRALQSALGLSQSAVSRLVSSVRGSDPLATLASIPGPEALNSMLRGAARSRIDAEVLDALTAAVATFERFIAGDVGDRGALEALLSEWALESRPAFEARHKAAAFKAMSALRGVKADLILNAGIVYPSGHPERFSSIGVDALIGCRRLRPSGVLRTFGSTFVPEGAPYKITGLAGQRVDSVADLLLPDFSTVSADQIQTVHHDHVMETSVGGLPLGAARAPGHDLVWVQILHGLHRAHRADGPSSSGIGGQAEPPCELCVVDAWLHDGVWPDAKPELRLFDTVVRGLAHPDDPSRQGDRIEMLETVQALGRAPQAFRLPEYPRYAELMERICAECGIDPARLRGFRARVRHPLYGSQIGLAFDLPP